MDKVRVYENLEIKPITTRQVAIGILIALIGSSAVGLMILKFRAKGTVVYSGKLNVQQSQKIVRSMATSAPINNNNDHITEMSFTIPKSSN